MSENELANLQFIDERERLYFEEARLGVETLQFMKSSVGRYLHGRAINQYEQAKEDLLGCNLNTWWGRRKARKIQQQAEIANNFMKWCADAIANGINAEQELEEYRG